MSEWKRYRRMNLAEMRPYRMGDTLDGVTVHADDLARIHRCEDRWQPARGFIARAPDDHDVQWYITQKRAEANFDLENPVEGGET